MAEKVTRWKNKITNNEYEMFSKTNEFEEKGEIRDLIIENLLSLESRLSNYFPNLEVKNYDWIRNPFLSSKLHSTHEWKEEEELTDLKHDRNFSLLYQQEELNRFWIMTLKTYPLIAKKAIVILLQFSTTYICEVSFSAMANIKTLQRVNLKMLDAEMRVSLSEIDPDLEELCISSQAQISH